MTVHYIHRSQIREYLHEQCGITSDLIIDQDLSLAFHRNPVHIGALTLTYREETAEFICDLG